MDLLSDFDIMDVVLGDENSDPSERKLANTTNGSISHSDTQVFSNDSGNSSQEKEIRDFIVENEIPNQDRLIQSMENLMENFSGKGFLGDHDALWDQQSYALC